MKPWLVLLALKPCLVLLALKFPLLGLFGLVRPEPALKCVLAWVVERVLRSRGEEEVERWRSRAWERVRKAIG